MEGGRTLQRRARRWLLWTAVVAPALLVVSGGPSERSGELIAPAGSSSAPPEGLSKSEPDGKTHVSEGGALEGGEPAPGLPDSEEDGPPEAALSAPASAPGVFPPTSPPSDQESAAPARKVESRRKLALSVTGNKATVFDIDDNPPCDIPITLVPWSEREGYKPVEADHVFRRTIQDLTGGYKNALSPSGTVQASCQPLHHHVRLTLSDSPGFRTFNPMTVWRRGLTLTRDWKDVSSHVIDAPIYCECNADLLETFQPVIELERDAKRKIEALTFKCQPSRLYRFDVATVRNCSLPIHMRYRLRLELPDDVLDQVGVFRKVGHCIYRVVLPTIDDILVSINSIDIKTTINNEERHYEFLFDMRSPWRSAEVASSFSRYEDHFCIVSDVKRSVGMWTDEARYIDRVPHRRDGGPIEVSPDEPMYDGIALYIYTHIPEGMFGEEKTVNFAVKEKEE